MTNIHLQTSAKMALVLGVLLPIAETVRRANQLLDFSKFFAWFDDYMLGALLIFIAWRALKNKAESHSYLIAVWGIAVGGHFLSCLSQLDYYSKPGGDPGLFSTTFVLIIKVLILIYMITGLKFSINANKVK